MIALVSFLKLRTIKMLQFTLHFKFYLTIFLFKAGTYLGLLKSFRNIHVRQKKLPIIAEEL